MGRAVMIALLLAAQAASLAAQRLDVQVPATSVWSVDWITNHCPEFTDEDGRPVAVASCRVGESGEFATFQDLTYYYALYCVEERDAIPEWGSCDDPDSVNSLNHSLSNAAVFERRRGDVTMRLILSRFIGWGDFREPRIVESPQGAVMELPLVLAATCECNAGAYYRWHERTRDWQLMDWHSWQKELDRKLPPMLTKRDGFWPELRTLTADGALWRPDDAHCCPTGKSVHVRLGIVDNRFVLESFRVDPPDLRH